MQAIAPKGKVGLMVCAHKEYWPQFPGLKEDFMRNANDFKVLLDNRAYRYTRTQMRMAISLWTRQKMAIRRVCILSPRI